MSDIDISVVLPTRGRTEALKSSIASLVETASRPHAIEILLAFDDDDTQSQDYFETDVVPLLNDSGVVFEALSMPRLGYARLNEYVNRLVSSSQGQWVMMFNDDARMITANWDDVVRTYNDRFALLRADTNHEHPYAIFPILPREWYDLFGYLSPHQLNDAWVSQIGFMLDLVVTVPIYIEHDRFDITGKNKDATYDNRPQLEGNPSHPADFNHASWRHRRLSDCARLANHLEQTRGVPMTWWHNVLRGKQDPWQKMIELDVKNRLKVFPVKQGQSQ